MRSTSTTASAASLPGMEADLVVLDLEATPLIAQRTRRAASLDEALFALLMLGDDRAIRATYVGGRCVHRRDRDAGSRDQIDPARDGEPSSTRA